MDSSGTGRRKTATEPTCELGVAAGHERRSLLMANLNDAKLLVFLTFSNRFHDAIDPVTWNPKDSVDVPFEDGIDDNFGGGSRHAVPFKLRPLPKPKGVRLHR